MTIQIDLKPEVEARAIAEAKARDIPLEDFLASIIEGNLNGSTEDERILAMREAMHDDLFLSDLAETMEDFSHVDQE